MGKSKTEEYRIKANEFDRMMRRALSAPPLPERKPKAAAKKTGKRAASKK